MKNVIFCPSCGTKKQDNNARFCTGCGVDLSGLRSFVERGSEDRATGLKGVQRGARLILLGLLMIPVWLFIGAAFPPSDRFVEGAPSTTPAEAIAWIMMWIAFVAGAGRIAWAMVFETNTPSLRTTVKTVKRTFSTKKDRRQLPSAEGFHGASPGSWRTTDNLSQPVMRCRGSGEL